MFGHVCNQPQQEVSCISFQSGSLALEENGFQHPLYNFDIHAVTPFAVDNGIAQ